MKIKPSRCPYQRFSIKDAVVVVTTIFALAALICVMIYSKDSRGMERELLSETGKLFWNGKAGTLSELADSLTINEVNGDGWIELYNKEKNTGIDLSNCCITVNGVKKYTFPEANVLEAGAFSCIEGVGKLGTTEHDIIGISDESGERLKDIMIPGLKNGESYGCKTDGDISYCYLTASRGKSNSESSTVTMDELTFSVPGGFYNDSFLLELTAAQGRKIYYTLDGSEPTASSKLYEAPIPIGNKSGSNIRYATAEGLDFLNSYRPSSISMGTVVRAIAVGSRAVSGEIKTQSYFVGLKNASDLKNIPVLSIVTAPENLFDYFTGIYVSGQEYEAALARGEDASEAANYLNGWTREVNVEYFEPGKDKTFEGKMSVSMIRDISVSSPQKSLLLTAAGGAFAGSGLTDYYNGISNRLTVQTNRKDNNYKLREYLAGDLLADTAAGMPDIMPCVVFIDGEYWGAYMLRAEYDEKYIARHYGVDEADVLLAKNGRITNRSNYQQELGELYQFITDHDLREDANYEWVKAHMDIGSYLECFCANMYLANAEYEPDGLVMWRTIKEQGAGYEDGRWRFLMPRLDNTMKNKEAGKTATSSINTFLQAGASGDILFQSLLKNTGFRDQLGEVMTKMADDIFSEERVHSLSTELSARLKKMTVMSYKRFVGNQGDTFYTNEIDKIEDFFGQRRNYILPYTQEVISKGGTGYVGDDAISE